MLVPDTLCVRACCPVPAELHLKQCNCCPSHPQIPDHSAPALNLCAILTGLLYLLLATCVCLLSSHRLLQEDATPPTEYSRWLDKENLDRDLDEEEALATERYLKRCGYICTAPVFVCLLAFLFFLPNLRCSCNWEPSNITSCSSGIFGGVCFLCGRIQS